MVENRRRVPPIFQNLYLSTFRLPKWLAITLAIKLEVGPFHLGPLGIGKISGKKELDRKP